MYYCVLESSPRRSSRRRALERKTTTSVFLLQPTVPSVGHFQLQLLCLDRDSLTAKGCHKHVINLTKADWLIIQRTYCLDSYFLQGRSERSLVAVLMSFGMLWLGKEIMPELCSSSLVAVAYLCIPLFHAASELRVSTSFSLFGNMWKDKERFPSSPNFLSFRCFTGAQERRKSVPSWPRNSPQLR